MKNMQLDDMELAMAAGGQHIIRYDPTFGLTKEEVFEKREELFNEMMQKMQRVFHDAVFIPDWSMADEKKFYGK